MQAINRTLLVTLLALFGQAAQAEDIDIYSAETGATSKPNILFVIDSSANWANAAQHWPDGEMQGQAELAAVREVAEQLGEDINIGLLLFTEGETATNPNGPGGYVRFHMRPMSVTNKTEFGNLIGLDANCTDGDNGLNTTPNCIYKNFLQESVGTAKTDYSAALFEVFKYFGGYTKPENALLDLPGEGTVAAPVESVDGFGPLRYAGFSDPANVKNNADPYAFVDPAAPMARYNTLIGEEQNCANNYVIFIGNGFPVTEPAADCTLLENVGGDCTQLAMPVLETGTDVPKSVLLEDAVCGVYADQAACEAAAVARFGTAYASYRCVAGAQCASNTYITTKTLMDTTACGAYADQAACEASLPANTADTTYSCEEETSCSVQQALSPLAQMTDNSPCIPGSISPNGFTTYESVCATWAINQVAAPYSTHSQFSCTYLSTTGCPNKSAHWQIFAGIENVTGKTYKRYATTTTLSTTASTPFKMYGDYTLNGAVWTGTRAAPADNTARFADEWARFLHRTDVSAASGRQNITIYTIDAYNDRQDIDQTALLYNMAEVGGGKYFAAKNKEQLKDAMLTALSEIQSVNSAFASSSLPVSVNTQGTYLNQVFIGMFRPQSGSLPSWVGNLKQYKFKLVLNELKLADKNGDDAINDLDQSGFITPCADSFWSKDTNNYWDYPASDAVGSCTAQESQYSALSFYSDGPDGEVVEKGGAAQVLRGTDGTTLVSTNYVSRKLKTCDASNCTTLTDFNDLDFSDANDNGISAASLGYTLGTAAEIAAQRETLIKWIRGQDVLDENNNGIVNEMRPSVHGGIIHSQPAVIDYGDGNVVAYYGADNGILHAINAGTDETDGNELWGFIAPETYGRFKRLMENYPSIDFPSNPAATKLPKDYFFDGSIGVYQEDGKVWIFPTMRRGGRAVYAFNASHAYDPAQPPTIMWRKGCFSDGCSTDWDNLGQTWSKPKIGYIEGYEDSSTHKPKPVLVFGGGYDTCEDAETASTTCPLSPLGANIWFVDAEEGTVLKKYATLKSVPGDLALLKDNMGNLTYVYATDTGGNIYRVNVGSYDGGTYGDWSTDAIRIANLGEGTRKFLYGPDVVPYMGFNAVLAGTGNREQPLWADYPCNNGTGGIENRFFMIKDVVPGIPASPVVTTDLQDISGQTQATLVDEDGWFFRLGACEQAVNKPLTFAGSTYFGTNEAQDVAEVCGRNLGVARGYTVDFLTGARSVVTFSGGGLPPSPVAGVVDVDGHKVPFVIGGGGGGGGDPGAGPDEDASPFDPTRVKISPPSTRQKRYWHKSNDN